jgi:hypothetical protein
MRWRAPSGTRGRSLKKAQAVRKRSLWGGRTLAASPDRAEAKIVNDPRAQLRRGVAHTQRQTLEVFIRWPQIR